MPEPLDYRTPEPRPPWRPPQWDQPPPGAFLFLQFVLGVAAGLALLVISAAGGFVLYMAAIIALLSLVCVLFPGGRAFGVGFLSSIGLSVLAIAVVCGGIR
jgi:hypothetical protein